MRQRSVLDTGLRRYDEGRTVIAVEAAIQVSRGSQRLGVQAYHPSPQGRVLCTLSPGEEG